MKKLVIVALVVGAVAAAWFAGRDTAPSSAAGVSPDSNVATERDHSSPVEASPTPLPTRPSDGVSAPTKAAAADDFEVVDLKQLRKDDPSRLELIAQTPEEAAWLERRGYPRPSEWAERAQIPTAELERRVAAGDPMAMTMLADRLLESSSDWRRPAELLEEALLQGNVFSQSVSARVYAKFLTTDPPMDQRGSPIRRPVSQALTPLMIASQLGDYRAGEMLMSLGIDRYAPFEVSSAMTTAHYTIAQVNATRATRGLPPLVAVPRPGSETAMQASVNRQPVKRWRGW